MRLSIPPLLSEGIATILFIFCFSIIGMVILMNSINWKEL